MATSQPITETGTRGFLLWLRERQPYLYDRVRTKLPVQVTPSSMVAETNRQLSGLGIDADPLTATASTSATSSNVKDILSNILTGAAQVILTKQQLDAQKKIIDLQLERARQGLPPANIDPTQYGLPAPNVKLGLDAETKRTVFIVAGGLGLVGLAIYLLSGRRARRAQVR
jgi:hypothetical protein